MQPFLDEDFLLSNKTAQRLYHEYAAYQPIYDYHCHLNPRVVAENKPFTNLTEIWLAGDHYKWRGMRSAGIDERLITGDASDYEKFQAWAKTVPMCLGNPLYHWTHLELRRPFGITNTVLNPTTAETIWARCNELLATPEFLPRGIMKQMNVKMVGTTDDPLDTLEYHKAIAADSSFDIEVAPSWRPDKAFKIELEGFAAYIDKLGKVADIEIERFSDLLTALDRRLDHFAAHGCRAAVLLRRHLRRLRVDVRDLRRRLRSRVRHRARGLRTERSAGLSRDRSAPRRCAPATFCADRRPNSRPPSACPISRHHFRATTPRPNRSCPSSAAKPHLRRARPRSCAGASCPPGRSPRKSPRSSSTPAPRPSRPSPRSVTPSSGGAASSRRTVSTSGSAPEPGRCLGCSNTPGASSCSSPAYGNAGRARAPSRSSRSPS